MRSYFHESRPGAAYNVEQKGLAEVMPWYLKLHIANGAKD